MPRTALGGQPYNRRDPNIRYKVQREFPRRGKLLDMSMSESFPVAAAFFGKV